MILQRISVADDGVLVRFPCEASAPGQCIVFDKRYFVLAHSFNGIGSIVTRSKSAIDLPPGFHVDLFQPEGRGFEIDSSTTPLIITGGLGYAAGLSLVQHFIDSNQDFRMVSYTRHPAQIFDVMSLLGMKTDKITVWDTTSKGRPTSPFDPANFLIDDRMTIYYAGPRSLYEACRSSLDKIGLHQVMIRLNY